MGVLDQLIQRVSGEGKRVILPESTDERIIHAAYLLKEKKVAQPVLVGIPEEIQKLSSNFCISDIEIVNINDSFLLDEFAALYQKQRPNVSEKVALRLVKKPLIFGGMMVTSGKVDAMVAGAAHTTADVIQAAALTVGYLKGLSSSSSFFIMEMPDGRIYFYADCAVNISPSSEALADIAIATASSYRKLMGEEPLVAFLSFSSKGSASHPDVEKVSRAVKIAREKDPETSYDGEFQVDTALSKAVAGKKLKELGNVAGRANVLIFPDLDAGNIAYKITQYLAGAKAYGPVLQGFAKPVSDLSRGAKPQDIVAVAAITCLLS
ncbi:MAG: phosphate acetyltransferase [Candidatus Omnitrophica bacterium]|nr:phosphate acetyltransferase [Candidatus Omnitrophota bacterium]